MSQTLIDHLCNDILDKIPDEFDIKLAKVLYYLLIFLVY